MNTEHITEKLATKSDIEIQTNKLEISLILWIVGTAFVTVITIAGLSSFILGSHWKP
jgi:hypothetical protein